MESTLKKKVLIVDDHPIMRRGLTDTIESDPSFEVVHQLERAEQVLDILGDKWVDLMLIDVSLPGMSGIELVKNILFQIPDQKVLVISRHEESLYAERALRAGAKGYIMKFVSSDTLLQAVRKVLNGGFYLSDELNERILMNALHGKQDQTVSLIDQLSDREMEIFELIGRGKCGNDIAKKLHLAPKTVETYRSRIKEKMNFKNSTEMIYYAVKWMEDASRVE